MDGLHRLSAALDELAGESENGLPAAELPPRLVALHRAAARLHAEILRTTAAFDGAGAWQTDGALSAAAWLRNAARISASAASEQVRTSRVLRNDLPETAAALSTGEIGAEQVRVIARVAVATPQRRAALAAAEPILVDAARRLGPRQLALVVARWAEAVDPAAALADAECAYAARRLSLSPTIAGMVAIDGLLDPESGATVLAAVQALASPAVAGDVAAEDSRTPAQRRADALTQLARTALDAGTLSDAGGERPHLQLLVHADSLLNRSESAQVADQDAAPGAAGPGAAVPGAALLSGSSRDVPITGAAASRLACDAILTPILFGTSGPLDVGRSSRTVPRRLRRALAVRDRGCRFPGCDRPLSWCDAHHVVPWSHGGPTDLGNLLLLCRRHHRSVHEDGFQLTLSGYAVTVVRPDGSRLVDRDRPPPWPDTG